MWSQSLAACASKAADAAGSVLQAEWRASGSAQGTEESQCMAVAEKLTSTVPAGKQG